MPEQLAEAMNFLDEKNLPLLINALPQFSACFIESALKTWRVIWQIAKPKYEMLGRVLILR